MIIATAGHVDHGKTLLVKALTGVDTDRLPEEKIRNLTIDLGFAYMPIAGDKVLGFVDVPGHEKFIRNMLCGVAAIDFVLFIVAADDGPMPQTAEHLAILTLLGVGKGAVALTKIDRVDEDRLAEVTDEIAMLFGETSLADAPIMPVSAITGDGIDGLRDHLISAAGDIQPRDGGGNFRLAVDRSFNVTGAGVVVTGTVFSGEVAVGDQVMISTAGLPVRVRGIHAQDKKSDRGVAGDRCALNIAGPDLQLSSVSRGDWIVGSNAHNPARRIDVELRVIEDEKRPLAHWTPVHVHLGAVDVTGRVAILEGRSIAPGDVALVQLVLDHEIGAWHGDGLILRDQSAQRTIGGARVVDVFPPNRGRAKPDRLAYLHAMAEPDALTALGQLLDVAPNGLDLARFNLCRNLTPAETAIVGELTSMRRMGYIGFSAVHWDAIRSDIAETLDRWHRGHPDTAGATAPNIASSLNRRMRPEILAALLPELAKDGAIAFDGQRARLPRHAPELAPADLKLWKMVEPLMIDAGSRSITVRDLAQELGFDDRRLLTFLTRAARLGFVIQVAKNRFYIPTILRGLAVIAEELSAETEGGAITAKGYRDRSGIGRNLTIEVLEYFDKARFTRRVGEAREILRPAAECFRD
ncbi:MAG: selenocysteine-specific translation elongation factor [Pseudomonadota bacterium]|nr:selenocysteine-specific translation elongation factor [Pseudomonadota bacterium]